MILSIKNELYYQFKSKILLVLLLSLSIISVNIGNLQVSSVISAYNNIDRTVATYHKTGKDIAEDLNRPFNIDKQDGGVETIDNFLSYSLNNFYAHKIALKLENAPNQYLSSYMVFIFPMIMTIYAILICYSDIKYKTLDSKIMVGTKKQVHYSKIISIILIQVLSLCLGFISYVLSLGVFSKIYQIVDFNVAALGLPELEDELFNSISYLNHLPIQLFFILAVSTLLVIFFYYMTLFMKSSHVPLILTLIYFLLLPPLGEYDLKNQILSIHAAIFNNSASTFQAITVKSVGIINLLVTTIIIIVFSLIFSKIERDY